MPTLHLKRIEGSETLRGLGVPHGQPQSQIVLLLHTKTGSSSVDVVTAPGPLTTSGKITLGFRQEVLPHQSVRGDFRHLTIPT